MGASFGDKLKSIYVRRAPFIDMAVRFLSAVAAFFWIRSVCGFGKIFSVPAVLFVMALVAALLGFSTIMLFGGVILTGQAFAVSPECGAFCLCVLLIIYILFLRFVPEDAWAAVLMPLTLFFGVPSLIPLFCGLKRRPGTIFALIPGTVFFYLAAAPGKAAPSLESLPSGDYVARLRVLSGSFMTAEAVTAALAAAAVTIAVYSVRRLAFRYSFEAAIIFGGLVWLLFIALGNTVLETGFDFTAMAVGDCASVIVALIFQLLFLRLDYKRAKVLRFEDDDYYYYVRAVPKSGTEEEDFPGLKYPEDEEPRVPDYGAVRPVIDENELERRLTDSLKNL